MKRRVIAGDLVDKAPAAEVETPSIQAPPALMVPALEASAPVVIDTFSAQEPSAEAVAEAASQWLSWSAELSRPTALSA